ncbi:NAD(P)H-dependent flavin oxidoreductase [Hyphococcus luteus]|uniref:Nitronate monooxygenase n=1 Tax=Hyphococcus luteus TaxID=2058213 RepID=A0A2S7K0G6_9PROT|nr:nitronate monooxygenase [Marinicaulis flavus]PQA85992.1 nitronate monooxygenase [Marinicaulis flavus]
MADIAGNLSLPVICAPMFLVSGPDLVTAVCKEGVIGAFPFPNARKIETLDAWLDDLSRRVSNDPNAAPYAVNLTTHRTYDRLQDEIALIANHRPKIVITALGGPDPVLDTVHAYGGVVIADVNSLAYARKAAEKGADGLALVSSGAGGHTGSMAGFSFVSAVREFFDGLVVLAGGIGNGRAIRAAEILGADLSYMGTSFIAAAESLASDEYRRMLVEANFEDLVLSNALTGAYANYLRASLIKMGLDPDNPGKKASVDLSDSQMQIKAWRDVWSAGHGVGEVRAAQPASEIIAKLKTEYREALETPALAISKRSR